MPARLFREAMERILRNAETATLIAALSGGMDSVVTLHLLSQAKDILPDGTRIVAAHLNHGLRAEANGDQDFCRAYAERLGIPFAEKRIDIAAFAKTEKLGVEEAGRIARYRFFHSIGGVTGLVVTGHHADDQVETILMNLRRGAHRRGLSGMRETGSVPLPDGAMVRVAKPLLSVERDVLRQYALAHKLEWREDVTNADNAYTRNKIRNRIVPALERLMPGFRRRLLERAETTAQREEELSREAAALAERQTRREATGLFFRLDENTPAQPELLAYAFRHVVEEETGARLPSGAVLTRLAELAEHGRHGETLSLTGRLRARRERGGVFFFSPDQEKGRKNADAHAEIILPDPPFRIAITAHKLVISAEWRETADSGPPPEDRADPNVEWLDADDLRPPLRLRPPREGERFLPMGAPGSRKIQDILVDAKVPRRLRGLPRVLADGDGGEDALWLWPLRLAHRARLRGTGGKALRICVREAVSGLPEQSGGNDAAGAGTL